VLGGVLLPELTRISGEPVTGSMRRPRVAAEFLCPLTSLIDEDARVPALLFAIDSVDG
jgi:hypothetical protein